MWQDALYPIGETIAEINEKCLEPLIELFYQISEHPIGKWLLVLSFYFAKFSVALLGIVGMLMQFSMAIVMGATTMQMMSGQVRGTNKLFEYMVKLLSMIPGPTRMAADRLMRWRDANRAFTLAQLKATEAQRNFVRFVAHSEEILTLAGKTTTKVKEKFEGLTGLFKRGVRGAKGFGKSILTMGKTMAKTIMPFVGFGLILSALGPVLEMIGEILEVIFAPIVEFFAPILEMFFDWLMSLSESQRFLLGLAIILALVSNLFEGLYIQIKGTKVSLGMLTDALAMAMVMAVIGSDILERFGGILFEVFTKGIAFAGEKLAEFATFVGTAFAQLATAISQMLPQIIPTLVTVATEIVNIFVSAIETALAYVDPFTRALMNFINIILRWAEENFQLIGQALLTAFSLGFQWLSANWDLITQYLESLFRSVLGWLADNIGLFSEEIATLLANLGGILKEKWEKLVAPFKAILDKVFTVLSVFIRETPEAIITLLKTIGGVISEKWKELQESFKTVFSKILGWLSEIIPDLPELKLVIQAIGDWFKTNWMLLTGFFNTVFTKLIGWLSTLPFVTTLIDFLKAIGDWLLRNWSLLQPYLSDLVTNVINYMIEEIRRQILAMVGTIFMPALREVEEMQIGGIVRRPGLYYLHPYEEVRPLATITREERVIEHGPITIRGPIIEKAVISSELDIEFVAKQVSRLIARRLALERGVV